MAVKQSHDPLRHARVFLSHSWADIELADALAESLAQRHCLLYDRTLIRIGEAVLPREAVVRSDFFLFLASDASMAERSMSFAELRIADASRLRRENRIGLVAVDDHEIEEEWSDALFERIRAVSASEDVDRILDSLRERLIELGGLRETEHALVGGASLEPILDYLMRPTKRGAYPFAAVFRKPQLDGLIKHLIAAPAADRDQIVSNLVDIYLQDSSRERAVIRHNSVYVLSRIDPGNEGLAAELRAAYPERAEMILYRVFHVALGFLGDAAPLHHYVERLALADDPQWREHREFNAWFHRAYYGSIDGALSDLRAEIAALDPPNLLPLDVMTVGDLSASHHDVDLLEHRRDDLVATGVDERVLQQAIAAVRGRAREP